MRAKSRATDRLVQLHYVMGGIYNALENPDESLKSYRAASTDLGRLPGKEVSPESADWKGVVDLKLAEHQIRTKEYKEAQ